MRDLFPGWMPPDEETLSQYWDEATFAVDTSVLLDLYRFSQEARRGLLEVLRSFGERLWVPHQVAFEFHRNRFGVLLDQREAEGALLGELDQIRGEIDDQLSKRLRGAGRRDLAPLREAIDGGFSRLQQQLEKAEKAHTEGLGDSIREDPIYDEVVDLCGDRIGTEFDEKRMKEVCTDAEERFKKEVPPGYLDAEKDGDARFGDVILWHQLCEMAAETGRPVVLVADDRKADWVWEVRGKTLGPRPELVAEMKEHAGVGFHLYTPARLLQVWGEREEGREVGEGVLDEIETPSTIIAGRAVGKSQMARFVTDMAAAMGNWPILGILTLADHRFVDDAVELSIALSNVVEQLPPPEVHVAVHDPTGRTFMRSVPLAGLEAGGYKAVIRYPEQFGGAGELLPGEYRVEWFVAGALGARRLKGDHRVAQESFVVPSAT